MSETPSAAPAALTVSVALCTHNGAAYVGQQVASILAQRPAPLELVVGDDASSDDTVAIIEAEYARARAADPELATELVIRRHATALGVRENFADTASACRGLLIALSDQDDVWALDKLARILPLFAENRDLLLVHTDARLVDADGVPLGQNLLDALEITAAEREGLTRGDSFAVLIRRNLVTGATVVLRRRLLRDAIPFADDWVHDEWLAALAAGLSPDGRGVRLIDEPLIDYRQHGANQIGARTLSFREKIARLREPRNPRLQRLARRAWQLSRRLEGRGAPESSVIRADMKFWHIEGRANFPRSRLLRLPLIIRGALYGRYNRYSRGGIDVVRDIFQPPGEREESR